MNNIMKSQGTFQPNYTLYSWALIVLFSVFQVIRWNHLPQFIDDYYHLLVAQNFVKAGGWVGWDFFEYAPIGRPHLYPPLYHVILAFFLEKGVDGLLLIKSAEVLIVPVFFIVLFFTCREVFSSFFAFCAVLICGSYFHFFVALTSNIPATLGMIFGLLFFLGIQRKDLVLAAISLILCFYAHSGISLIFLITGIVYMLLAPQARVFMLKVSGIGVFGALPLFWHQCRYLAYIKPDILAEQRYVHINVVILFIGIIGLFFIVRNRGNYLIILGLILASLIVFFNYFYRYFAAQGFLGWALSASACIEYLVQRLRSDRIRYLLLSGICLIIFFVSPTFMLDDLKPSWKLTDSTFSNYAQGKTFQTLPFTSIFSPRYFHKMLQVVRNESIPSDVIGSNIKIASIVTASLTGRLTADALFYEVRPVEYQRSAKLSHIFIWVKSETNISSTERRLLFDMNQSQWLKIYENDLFMVLKADRPGVSSHIPKSRFPMIFLYFLIGSFCSIAAWRMFKYSRIK